MDHLAPASKLEVKYRSSGYRRHELVGINAFLLEMMNQFSWIMGLWTSDYMSGALNGLPNAIDNMVQQAQANTARMDVTSSVANGTLTADVQVTNLTGHRFPSGVGFRRAFLELPGIREGRRHREDDLVLGPDR